MLIDLLLENCRGQYQSHLRTAVNTERLRYPELVTSLRRRSRRILGQGLLLTRIDMVWGDPRNPELMNADLELIKATSDEDASESVIDEVLVKV